MGGPERPAVAARVEAEDDPGEACLLQLEVERLVLGPEQWVRRRSGSAWHARICLWALAQSSASTDPSPSATVPAGFVA
jgi:hypothetical protein